MRTLTVGLMCVAMAAIWVVPAEAIVGGKPAAGDWPAFAQLQINGKTECGATLVRSRWVLTAAHCVIGLEPSEIGVIVGSKLRGVGEPIPAKSYAVHEGFADSIPVLVAAWDVAVVELTRAVAAPPMRIATDPAVYTGGTPALAIGLGADGFAYGSYRDELWQAELPITPEADCERVFAGRYDPDQHICAGTFENEQNVCQGDSGGPLMVRDRGEWVIVGTTSFGIGCATPGTYNVFARAAGDPLRNWIEGNLPPPEPPAVAAPSPSASPGEPARSGQGTTAPAATLAAPAQRRVLVVARARRGARSLRVTVEAPATVVVRDARGKVLGRSLVRGNRTVSVRIRVRRPLRAGRYTVSAGTERRTIRVR